MRAKSVGPLHSLYESMSRKMAAGIAAGGRRGCEYISRSEGMTQLIKKKEAIYDERQKIVLLCLITPYQYDTLGASTSTTSGVLLHERAYLLAGDQLCYHLFTMSMTMLLDIFLFR